MEARVLMMSTNNILSPANGKPDHQPDAGHRPRALLRDPRDASSRRGSYREGTLTIDKKGMPRATSAASTRRPKKSAWPSTTTRSRSTRASASASIDPETGIRQRRQHDRRSLHHLARSCPTGSSFDLVNKTLDKKALSALIDACYRKHRNKATVLLADRLRSLGYEFATRAGVSICMDHMVIPDAKQVLLNEAQEEVQRVVDQYQEGLITDGERYNKIVDIWAGVADKVTQEMMQVIGKEKVIDAGDRQGVHRAELQPDLHHGRLGSPRLAPSRFVSSPPCVA